MSYETPDADDFIGDRFSHAGIRQPGQVDVLNLVVHLPDCVKTSLGPIEADVVSATQDRRYDHVPVSGLPTTVGWGLARSSVLKALHDARIELGVKDVDVSDSVLKVAGRPYGLDTLSTLLGFFSRSPATLMIYPHYDAIGAGTPPFRGQILGLLTISDLNHREVRRAAYELLLEVELSLVELLRHDQTGPWAWIESMASEDERARLVGYWELLRRRGVETSPETLLTLPQLLGIAGKSKWIRERLGFKSRSDLEASVHGLVDFRNRIMHPVRPLISAPEDVTRFEHTTRGLDALLMAVAQGRAE